MSATAATRTNAISDVPSKRPPRWTGTRRHARRRVPVHRGGRFEGTSLMAFVRVAAVADIGEGQGTLVEHGGLTIALFNAGSGRFVACSPTCPHEDGPLVEGWLDGNAVVCPW